MLSYSVWLKPGHDVRKYAAALKASFDFATVKIKGNVILVDHFYESRARDLFDWAELQEGIAAIKTYNAA